MDQPPVPLIPPVADRRPVTDTFHGVEVVDPYRWLEEDTAEVKAWSAQQNRYARSVLDELPELDALRAEVKAIADAPVTHFGDLTPAGDKLFALRRIPGGEQWTLVVMDSPEAAADARVVYDPVARADALTAIDWFVPSPDGTKVALSLSHAGSEQGTLHVIDLDGNPLDEPIPDVQRGTGGGHAAWRADGSGLWYTRYPAAGEQPDGERDFWMQVWFHTLGAPRDQDVKELADGLPRIAEIRLHADARTDRLLASVQNGDSRTFRHYLRSPDGTWKQLTDWADEVQQVTFGPTDDLWLVSRQKAPNGKVMKLRVRRGKVPALSRAKTVIRADKNASIITSFHEDSGVLVTDDRLVVTYQIGGPSELRSFSLRGRRGARVKLPPVSTTGAPVAWGDGVIAYHTSYVDPGGYRLVDLATGTTTPIETMSPGSPVDLSGYEVIRETARSRDGTKVPVNIVWKKGAPRDGSTPCLATGYGGYGISLSPRFVGGMAPLLERGLCFVVVNLRGGGEFGEDWHRAGMLTSKQNVFDDFAAALDLLSIRGYTRPGRLAIMGGSNGGLLMGAILTQHPESVRVVVANVGVFDSLRAETAPNGAYNVPEYGSVTDPDQFKALRAYSPYHNVRIGAHYPAVLLTTGANDPRVPPWHSRKMCAALQAAQAGDAPILLRTSDTSGHGPGMTVSERVDSVAHSMAFILSQVPHQTPATPTALP